MKPLAALGFVLLIVGAMLTLALPGLRPLGGAFALCGLALIVYAFLPSRAKRRGATKGNSWEEDDGRQRPREIYTANPGDVAPRPRYGTHEPEFTNPTPGVIPPPRQQASGGKAEYTTGPSEIPEPRERDAASPEYVAPAGELEVEAEPPRISTQLPREALPGEDLDMPPMAPPPPAR